MKTQASASEVALAGKGFNKQVEDSYKAKHADANFAAVDRMLKISRSRRPRSRPSSRKASSASPEAESEGPALRFRRGGRRAGGALSWRRARSSSRAPVS